MLYGSETWCLKEKEILILRRTGKSYGESNVLAKLIDKKTTEELMDMLGLKEMLDKLAKECNDIDTL